MKSATFCTAAGLTSSPFFFRSSFFTAATSVIGKKKYKEKTRTANSFRSSENNIFIPVYCLQQKRPYRFSATERRKEPDGCEDITAADFQTFPGKVELAKWTERSGLLVPLLGRSSAEAKRKHRRLRETAQGSQGTSSNHRWFSTRIQSGG